ncbi:IS1634 family transposase [Acidithrix sp. C25]|uniref:IS1634 family transposase n=1 Tax=Acidithrix sp. C25 TaxID=1671482 RepID=UPI00191BA566|nr:IS1634 family transposase [Acidithrix sp. C25]CAG4929899.1 unnamed protein product [Acidithrix sp. C25]
MFIREKTTKNKATGTKYIKHQLVRSYREGDKVRQEIVMDLGRLEIDPKDYKKLAQILTMRLAGSESLFEGDLELKSIADKVLSSFSVTQTLRSDREVITKDAEFLNVNTSSLEASDIRRLGPELIASSFYDRLKIKEQLLRCGLSEKETAIAKAVICARLVAPSSDLETHRFLKEDSALYELVDQDLSNIGKDAIYEIADAIYEAKDSIEMALIKAENELYPTNKRLFLFDLTNAYFEGRTLGNDLAQYGHSKEKRFDCTLVSLALLVDDRGLPIYSHIYPGNQSEPETLGDVLSSISSHLRQGLFSEDLPTVIMDRGIATYDNIALIESYGLSYLVITRANAARHYLAELRQGKDTFLEIKNSSNESIYIKELGDDLGVELDDKGEAAEAGAEMDGKVGVAEGEVAEVEVAESGAEGEVAESGGHLGAEVDSEQIVVHLQGIESMGIESMGIESMGIESMGIESMRVDFIDAGSLSAHPQANHSLGGESLGIDSMDTAPQVGGPQAKHSQSNEPQANHSNRAQPYASDSMDNKIKQILCISERRRDKEEAIARGMQTKFQSAFDKLADSVKRGQYSNATTVASRIGKLKQEHRSIARRYEIDTITGDDQKVKELVLTEKPKVKEAAETLYGAYVIETNRNDLEPEEIWKLYMTLTKVEDAFKALKSNLGMRPIYHQLASRTAAHLFISVVAYHLYGAIALSLSQAGDKRSVHSILAQVSTHSRLNVTMLDDNKRLHNLRISSTPNSTQKEIYSILGVVDTLARTKKVIAQL